MERRSQSKYHPCIVCVVLVLKWMVMEFLGSQVCPVSPFENKKAVRISDPWNANAFHVITNTRHYIE